MPLSAFSQFHAVLTLAIMFGAPRDTCFPRLLLHAGRVDIAGGFIRIGTTFGRKEDDE